MVVSKKHKILSRAALIGLALIWGFAFVVMKNTLDSLDALELLTVRFFLACLVPAAISGKRLLHLSKRGYIGGLIIGIATGLAYAVQNIGLTYTTPGKNAFITAFYCIVTPFLCWVAYKRKPKTKNILAAVICIIGLGFVSLGNGDASISKGDIFSFFGALCFAVQIVFIEEYQNDGDIFSITAIEFFIASLTCLLLALVFHKPLVPIPGNAWPGILYLGLMSSALGNILQLYGQLYTPSSQAAVIMSLESVFAAIISLMLGMETGSVPVFIGFGLIFGSVVLNECNIKKKNSQT